jgi:hypothetical protein
VEVEWGGKETDLGEMLERGEIDALISADIPKCVLQNSPNVGRLFVEPIHILILEKLESGKWKARELSEDELGQHKQMVKTLEDEFPKFVKRTFSEPSGEPIP